MGHKNLFSVIILGTLFFHSHGHSFTSTLTEKIDSISSSGTALSSITLERNMLPRGSALITDSGKLKNDGIDFIIHAASGSMTSGDKSVKPSLQGVKLSITNSLKLAHENGVKRVALPFIGSSIFIHSIGITKNELATQILDALDRDKTDMEKVMVIYNNPAEYMMFNSLHQQLGLSDKIKIVEGSITQFTDHEAEAIINAANTEVQFGGGVSGVIGRASEEAQLIDQFAVKEIKKFNQEYLDLYQSMLAQAKEDVFTREENKSPLRKDIKVLENEIDSLMMRKNSLEKSLNEVPAYAYVQIYLFAHMGNMKKIDAKLRSLQQKLSRLQQAKMADEITDTEVLSRATAIVDEGLGSLIIN